MVARGGIEPSTLRFSVTAERYILKPIEMTSATLFEIPSVSSFLVLSSVSLSYSSL